jgi:general secretion pathway protein I
MIEARRATARTSFARKRDSGFAREVAGSPPLRGRRPARPAGGFSLLEVLAAFVILALVATALFRLFSGALANVAAADDYGAAAMVAQSALDEASLPPLREGTKDGTALDGRITWLARIEPYTPPDVPPELQAASEALPVRLWRIAVDVTFPGANGAPRTITVATTRVGAKESRQ